MTRCFVLVAALVAACAAEPDVRPQRATRPIAIDDDLAAEILISRARGAAPPDELAAVRAYLRSGKAKFAAHGLGTVPADLHATPAAIELAIEPDIFRDSPHRLTIERELGRARAEAAAEADQQYFLYHEALEAYFGGLPLSEQLREYELEATFADCLTRGMTPAEARATVEELARDDERLLQGAMERLLRAR